MPTNAVLRFPPQESTAGTDTALVESEVIPKPVWPILQVQYDTILFIVSFFYIR